MADITPARKLFDLLVSRDFDPELLDSSGKPASDPGEAEIFSFDFRAESGKDYGTVVIMLSDEGELQVYCADNVGKTMEGQDKTDWFSFLEQLKNFAVRTNRLDFGIKNLNHLRYSMQGQAAIKEGLFESWAGKKDVSWNAGATESRLMIKHKRSLGEDEARFRYVESLFIETAEGERYKLPFKNLTAGKAMLEHVRNGGRPYDMRGQHISEMVSELNVLSRFRRANQGKLLEGDTEQLVEQTNTYYENLQRNLKSLTHRRGYDAYFESWAPAEISEESIVIEGLKHLFITQSIDQRIEDALPLIAKIQQQENAMKEANIFEAWADKLVEGTWQTPDTPEKQAQLLELMSTDLPVGADATNATEQLYDLLGDDELFDQLQALAEQDANADARQVVLDRMQELSDDPDVRHVIEQLNIDATAEMNPAEPTNPDDLEPQEPVQESDLEDCDSIGGDKSDSFIRDVSMQQKDLAEDALQSIRRSAGMLTEAELDELNRRDFLKGAGAALGGAALAGLAGGAQAATGDIDPSRGFTQANADQKKATQWEPLVNYGDKILKGPGTPNEKIGSMYGYLEAVRRQASTDPTFDNQVKTLGASIKNDKQAMASAQALFAQVTKFLTQMNIDYGGLQDPRAGLGQSLVKEISTKYQNFLQNPTSYLNIYSTPGLRESRLMDDSGETIDHILNRFKHEVKKFEQAGELDDDLYHALFDYYCDSGDMPYGTAKARDGDPYEWVANNLESHLSGGGIVGGNPDEDYGIERESVGDYANEYQDDLAGILKIAGVPPQITPAPDYMTGVDETIAPLPGEQFGDDEYKFNNNDEEAMDENDASLFDDATCNMSEAGESCPVHGVEECWANSAEPESSPLAGQYGHSGKMQAVDKNVSFLDRLKELSGRMRSDKI